VIRYTAHPTYPHGDTHNFLGFGLSISKYSKTEKFLGAFFEFSAWNRIYLGTWNFPRNEKGTIPCAAKDSAIFSTRRRTFQANIEIIPWNDLGTGLE